MPSSRNGRNTCSPPIDCRTSSPHTLNSATCPEASVCPWCQRASPSTARRFSLLTTWVGVAQTEPHTDRHENQTTRRQTALPPQRRTEGRRPAQQARHPHRRTQDTSCHKAVHGGGDELQTKEIATRHSWEPAEAPPHSWGGGAEGAGGAVQPSKA